MFPIGFTMVSIGYILLPLGYITLPTESATKSVDKEALLAANSRKLAGN